MRRNVNLIPKLLAVFLFSVGCPQPDDATPNQPQETVEEILPFATHVHQKPRWKRFRNMENDIARALNLPTRDLCFEVGVYSCFEQIHRVSLGGNDPFIRGMYQPIDAPSITTFLSLDRVLLQACQTKLEKEKQSPDFFPNANWTQSLTDSSDSELAAVVEKWSQQFFSRDPTEEEIQIAQQWATEQNDATIEDFTFAMCFALGTHLEFLFH